MPSPTPWPLKSAREALDRLAGVAETLVTPLGMGLMIFAEFFGDKDSVADLPSSEQPKKRGT